MVGSGCKLVIIFAAFTLLISLLVETRSLNSFLQTSNHHTTLTYIADNTTEKQEGENVHYSHANQNWKRRISIPSNSNSTIASDISDIWHDPQNQAICISLKENAKCPHPAFLGRLSGPVLTLLEWNEPKTDNTNEFIHCGTYKHQWLKAGTYFLDIIVLFCNDFGIHAMTRTQNESAWLSYDFSKDCMEDPNNNRITGEQSQVTLIEQESLIPNVRHKGRWISNMTADDPLYTRYQPKGCRRNPMLERCAVPMNDTILTSYSFEWENNVLGTEWSRRLRMAARRTRTRSNEQHPLSKICLVGFSHSRFLKNSFGAIGLGNYVHHIQARYPSDVGEWLFHHYYTNHNCTNFIVGVAQWPGSFTQGSPYLFDRYYLEMKRIVQDAATTFLGKEKENINNVKVYMRSVHPIPIGDVTGACPITDWRSPVVMDGYTHVIQKAVKEIQEETDTKHVEFLDTRFIVSPMWDNAFDWIHLRPQVSDVEALYMASIVYDNLLNDPKMMPMNGTDDIAKVKH